MKSFLILLVACTCVLGIVAEQNLCDVETGSDLVFVNDPAICNGYLWCNFDANQRLLSVHQGECPTDFNFNPTAFACDRQYTCQPICESEDIAAIEQVAVAVPEDLTCKEFQVCRAGVLGDNVFTCGGDFVFNRALGVCMEQQFAPCTTGGGSGGGTPPGDCAADEFGFLPDPANCTNYFFCNGAGERAHLACPEGFEFNPEPPACVLPENRVPLCPNTSMEPFGPIIPRPPLINTHPSVDQPAMLSGWEIRNRIRRVF